MKIRAHPSKRIGEGESGAGHDEHQQHPHDQGLADELAHVPRQVIEAFPHGLSTRLAWGNRGEDAEGDEGRQSDGGGAGAVGQMGD